MNRASTVLHARAIHPFRIQDREHIADPVLAAVLRRGMGLVARPMTTGVEHEEPVLVLERVHPAELLPERRTG
jgi:hypothetical protein